ncbi:MAG TPA: xanthine dehydrogenase family protein molybdopterin-binding subunit, partial [Chloroflexota bacterium]
RATAAHARIRRLDASAAERLPGVVGILVGADLLSGGIKPTYGPVFPDRPLVAIDKVRFAGEPLAVVIAEDLDIAQQALSLIDVDFEHLPAYVEPEAAMAPEAVSIHDEIPLRDFVTYPDLILHTDAGHNIFNYFRLRRGDVRAGLISADHVFEHTYRTPAQQHVSLEPHVAMCEIRDGRATVWSSASSPYTARFQVAETLGLPQSHVRVVVWNIGGAFGGKTYPRIEPLVAAASWRVGGRPVRLEFSRAEEFYTIARHASVVTIRTGVQRDGVLVAREVRILWGAGAYADISPRTIKNGGWAAIGPYRVPNASVDSFAVYTNTTPAGGFRGYGVPQVCWAYERQMDDIAHALDVDPLELRLRNALHEGDAFSTGQVMHDVHIDELLRSVGRRIGWQTPLAPASHAHAARGRGVAATVKGTITPSTSTASIKLNEDGSVNLLVSTTEIGQGSRTVLAQIAADALGIPLESVRVAYPDTDLTPWDQTTSSSRSTAMMGGAVRYAAEHVHRQLIDIAAQRLEVDPSDVEIDQGDVHVRGAPSRRLTFAEVVHQARRGNIVGYATHTTQGGLDPVTGQGIATHHFAQSACAAEVEVDLDTGSVRVVDLAMAAYAGSVIHPTFAELQVEGNATFGIGQGLMEEIVIEGGQVANATLGDYLIPSVRDIPPRVSVDLLEDASGQGQVHGLGEGGAPVVPAAIANAVFAACGASTDTLPLTPERVLRAIYSRGRPDQQ